MIEVALRELVAAVRADRGRRHGVSDGLTARLDMAVDSAEAALSNLDSMGMDSGGGAPHQAGTARTGRWRYADDGDAVVLTLEEIGAVVGLTPLALLGIIRADLIQHRCYGDVVPWHEAVRLAVRGLQPWVLQLVDAVRGPTP